METQQQRWEYFCSEIASTIPRNFGFIFVLDTDTCTTSISLSILCRRLSVCKCFVKIFNIFGYQMKHTKIIFTYLRQARPSVILELFNFEFYE